MLGSRIGTQQKFLLPSANMTGKWGIPNINLRASAGVSTAAFYPCWTLRSNRSWKAQTRLCGRFRSLRCSPVAAITNRGSRPMPYKVCSLRLRWPANAAMTARRDLRAGALGETPVGSRHARHSLQARLRSGGCLHPTTRVGSSRWQASRICGGGRRRASRLLKSPR